MNLILWQYSSLSLATEGKKDSEVSETPDMGKAYIGKRFSTIIDIFDDFGSSQLQ